MSKNLKTRLQMKSDTAAAWQRVSDAAQVDNVFIPLKAEPIFYETVDENNHITFAMKIGDGIHTVDALPFFQGSTPNTATTDEIDALFSEFPSFAFTTASNDEISSMFAKEV